MTLSFHLQEPEESHNKQCPRCGAINPYVNLFCLGCGTVLETPQSFAARSEPQPAAQPMPSTPAAPPQPRTGDWSHYWNQVLGAPTIPVPTHRPTSLPAPPPRPLPPVGYQRRYRSIASSAIDRPNPLLNFASFVCPLTGLVSYLGLVKQLPRTAASAGRSGAYGLLVTSILLIGLALKSHVPQVRHTPVVSYTPYPSAAPSGSASVGASGNASGNASGSMGRNGSGTYYQDILARMDGTTPSYRSVGFTSRRTRRSCARRRMLSCTPTRCTPTRRASARRASARRACTRCTPVRRRAL